MWTINHFCLHNRFFLGGGNLQFISSCLTTQSKRQARERNRDREREREWTPTKSFPLPPIAIIAASIPSFFLCSRSLVIERREEEQGCKLPRQQHTHTHTHTRTHALESTKHTHTHAHMQKRCNYYPAQRSASAQQPLMCRWRWPPHVFALKENHVLVGLCQPNSWIAIFHSN